MDDLTLIRAIVIGIAYREKIKSRHDMLQRPTNKQLCQAVNKAANTCNLSKPSINDLPEFEKYFKYKLITLNLKQYYIITKMPIMKKIFIYNAEKMDSM